MMVKEWLGGLGMGGQRHIDLLEDMDSVGSGGRFGNGRANIYILKNTARTILGWRREGCEGWDWEGKDIMISLKYMDGVGSGGRGWEWEGKCIQIGKYNRGQIYDGEGMVGRVGNGRAKTY